MSKRGFRPGPGPQVPGARPEAERGGRAAGRSRAALESTFLRVARAPRRLASALQAAPLAVLLLAPTNRSTRPVPTPSSTRVTSLMISGQGGQSLRTPRMSSSRKRTCGHGVRGTSSELALEGAAGAWHAGAHHVLVVNRDLAASVLRQQHLVIGCHAHRQERPILVPAPRPARDHDTLIQLGLR